MIEDLHERMAAAVAAAKVPGAVVIVADREEVLYAEAFGRRRIGDAAPMTLDTIFWLASMTKAVTSAAAMQLVERGELRLDAPIDPLLPELRRPQVLTGFDVEGAPTFRPARRPITLRHLMTHTSGLGYDTFNADLLRARGAVGPSRPGERAGLVGPLLFDPGGGWEYGVSTDWLGLAIEAASGQRLDDYLEEHVLRPLKMSDTAFVTPESKLNRLAAMHQRHGDGALTPIPSPVAEAATWDVRLGGAGLLGTAGDYIRFMRMILGRGALDGVRVLTPKSVKMLSRNQTASLPAGAVRSIFPNLNNPFEPLPGASPGWTLGFLINPKRVPHGRAARSLSWAGMANTYYWIDPASNLCAVLMTQLFPFADRGVLELMDALEAAVYAPPSSKGLFRMKRIFSRARA